MPLKNVNIKKILVISLSNIGDCILTFPVIDILKRDFPDAKLFVVIGPKAEPLFEKNPHVHAIGFDKHHSSIKKLRWVFDLGKEKFDLIIDLRNTAIPFLIPAKYRTPLTFSVPKDIHMKTKHLNRLKTVLPFENESPKQFAFYIPGDEMEAMSNFLDQEIGKDKKFVTVGPGAANHLKRWRAEGFARVCDHLVTTQDFKIVFVGDNQDRGIVDDILKQMNHQALNLVGRTSLIQLGAVLQRSHFVLVNDSAIMHLASYLNVPVLALFGPTGAHLYGPWSQKNYVIEAGGASMDKIRTEDVQKVIDEKFF